MNTNTVQITLRFKDDGTIAVVDQAKGKVKDLDKTVKDSQGTLATAQEGWSLVAMKVAAASAAFYTAKRLIYDTAVQIAAATNDIERQAAVIGMSTTELQKWQYAAKMSDVNAQELAIGIKLLSTNMEAGNKYFGAMGISVKNTAGHLRPLNEVMGDIMDKFASWQDGPRKIAIAVELFGRSGETLIPLLNKGRIGFNEFAEEARKLGIVLSPDLILKGSQAEDIFKRINVQLEAGKLKMAPYALEVAKFSNEFLGNLNKIKEWAAANPRVFNFILGTLPGGNLLSQLGNIKEIRKTAEELRAEALGAWEPGPTPIPKKPAPALPTDLKKYFEEQKPYYESLSKMGEQMEKMAYGGMEEGGFWQQLKEGREELEKTQDAFAAAAARLMELDEAAMEGAVKINEEYEKYGMTLDEISARLEDSKLAHQAWLEEYTKVSELETIYKSFGENISSVWSENVSGMIKGTTDFKDAFTNMVKGMGDAFISAVSKMITQWLIFGSVTGKKEEGGGFLTGGSWGGILGSIVSLFKLGEGGYLPGKFTPIKAFQGGGYVNRPTLGMVGEGGEGEYIIPESKMGRGDTYIINNYNQVTDPNTFVRIYGGAVKKLSEQSVAETKRFNKIGNRS